MIDDNEQDGVEAAVENFRAEHGIPDDIMVDMLDLLRRMQIQGTITGIEVHGDSSLAGTFDPEKNVIALAKNVLDRQSVRDRFTIAHEIAHKIAGHSEMRHRRMGSEKQFGRQVGRDEEQANAIAATLLIPERLANVTQTTDAAELAAPFNVSLSVAKLRLTALQRRQRIRMGIRRPLPTGHLRGSQPPVETDEPQMFDTGDYDAVMPEMMKNALRWNS